MADESAEQPFFIYDHSVLQKEEDDINDAIIYYYPPMTSIDDRCALCGQLMGMVTFFISIAGSPPSIYRLHKSKFVVRHQGRFTLALGGDQRLPDRVLVKQLDSALQLFRFYHRDITDVAKLCEKQKRKFVDYLGIIWDTYIPFTRYYGDDFLSSMRPVPAMHISRNQSALFLRATHLLEACQRAPGVLAGCLIVRNRVLSTQLTPSFTSRLLLLRPHQTHLPCRAINTDFTLPVGVRLLAVYITEEEEKMLYPPWYEAECEDPEWPHVSTEESSISVALSTKTRSTPSSDIKESEEDTLSFVSLDGKTPRSSPDPGHGQPDNLTKGDDEVMETSSANQEASKSSAVLGRDHMGQDIEKNQENTPQNKTEGSTLSSKDFIEIEVYCNRITASLLTAALSRVSPSIDGISGDSHTEQSICDYGRDDQDSPQNTHASEDSITNLSQKKDLPSSIEELAVQIVQAVIGSAKDQVTKHAKDIKCATGEEAVPSVKSIEKLATEIVQTALLGALESMYNKHHVHASDCGDRRSSIQIVADEISRAVVENVSQEATDVDMISDQISKRVVRSVLSGDTSTDMLYSGLIPEGGLQVEEPGECESLVNLANAMSNSILEDVMTAVCLEISKAFTTSQDNQIGLSMENQLPDIDPEQEGIIDVVSMEETQENKPITIGKPKTKHNEFQQVSAGVSHPGMETDELLTVNVDVGDSATSVQHPSPLSPKKDSLPLTPLVPATKTELFKAVKHMSKIAVKNYEAFTSAETSPEMSPYQGQTRNNSRASSDHGSTESDASRIKTLSVEKTMKRLVHLTQPLVAAQQSSIQHAAHQSTVNTSDSPPTSETLSATGSQQSSSPSSVESLGAKNKAASDKIKHKEKRSKKKLKKGSDELSEMDLYIQGNADILILLVMESGASQDKDAVNKLWKLALPQLGEIDLYVKNKNIGVATSTRKDLEYNYLHYNSSQQTLKGNKMQPVTGSENQFCQTAVTMHDDFCSSETLTDIMLRSHSSFVYGHQSAGQETYFQVHNSARNMAGFPNERELNMSADAVAYQKMLTEEHALII